MTSEIPQRLAAILAADIAAYTRLMERGEAQVVARWRRARDEVIDPTIARLHGRIVKLTGDGFLAEFPTAESAVRAALAMQAQFAEMFGADAPDQRVAFRMGINLGDIWADKDDIYGAGVNVAARLEALAEPGTVCVSGSVYDAVKHKIDAEFRDLGPRSVKNVAEPVQVYRVGGTGIRPGSQLRAGGARRALLAYAGALALAVALAAGAYRYWHQHEQERWLHQEAIPGIEAMLEVGDFEGAYAQIAQARTRTPAARELDQLLARGAWRVDLKSEPAGARVLRRAYGAPDDAWIELGVTPLEDVYLPFGLSQLRLERDGSVPLLRAVGGGGLIFSELPARDDTAADLWYLVGSEIYRLDAVGSIPEDMVRVPGWNQVVDGVAIAAKDFFLDRYEVTNAQYKVFVDAGGYQDPRLWDPVIADGETLAWDDVPRLFSDRTGRPGPATWEGGNHPRGADDLPVTGISWYEAMAYARFMGRELPTVHHWQRAQATAMLAWELPLSRFGADGPLPVGSSGAASWVGAYDMLGNSQEWTATRRGDSAVIVGGAWLDRQRLYSPASISPLDRAAGNGLRLALTSDEPAVRDALRAPLPPLPQLPPVQAPVSDEVYAAYSRMFAYEPGDLRASIDETRDIHAWARQRISFDAAYPGPRMVLYLYLPRNTRPPYQTVVHWPGGGAWDMDSIDSYTDYLDFVVTNGRAVAVPVYQGTFERGDRGPFPAITSTAYRDNVVAGVKDLRRAIDYLQTRQDIDRRAIAFYGLSWGAFNGATALAQEPRLALAILEVGFLAPAVPEIHPVNALPRVRVPTLLMSGEFDPRVPLDNARRYFSLIGAPESDKKHVIGLGGHYIPREQMIRETLDWLDAHFGPPPRDLSQSSGARPPSVGQAPAEHTPARFAWHDLR